MGMISILEVKNHLSDIRKKGIGGHSYSSIHAQREQLVKNLIHVCQEQLKVGDVTIWSRRKRSKVSARALLEGEQKRIAKDRNWTFADFSQGDIIKLWDSAQIADIWRSLYGNDAAPKRCPLEDFKRVPQWNAPFDLVAEGREVSSGGRYWT